MVGAFVDGGANFLSALGIAQRYAIAIIAMLVACFAATTLDTATRLQRYVVQELAGVIKIPPLANKYVATTIAVGSALGLALMRGPSAPGRTTRSLWHRRTISLAPVRCDQPVAGRTGVHGDRVLPGPPQ